MSFQLVIAEKPCVARSIAAVIGADEKQNGYWQGGGYLVSWCIGHLVSFAEAGQYDEKYCKWKYEDLPILPQPWQFIVPDEKKPQFEIVRSLLNRPDVDSVTAATDAGREGELIFRFVYQMAGCTKPVKRLWISSMEDAAIREGFANLRPDSDYDALYQSALCRAKADWLVGINATRLFSVLYHKTLTVGRVQTPTLKMLVDRDAKILRFQKEKYYTVGIQSGSLKAGSGRIASMDEADTLRQACAGASAICSSVKREKKTEQPPKLYDLTTLQREANRLFGFTAKQTLDYAQQLYEKKLLTYPRTDSQYLTEDMGQTVQHLVSDLLGLLPFAQGLDLTPKVDRVLNSKKVSDHHAIIPVYVGQHEAIVSEDDWNLAQTKRQCTAGRREKVRDPDHAHILSGILKCPCCGRNLYGNVSKAHSKDNKTRYYYFCKSIKGQNGHECSFRLNIEQNEINQMVASIVSAMVHDPRFVDAIKEKIGSAVDTSELEQQADAIKAQLRQRLSTKSRLEHQMDTLDFNDPYYDRKSLDLQRRYDEQYELIEDMETQLAEIQGQVDDIHQEKITADNIYHLLLAFDEVYNAATEVEQKEFIRAFIEHIDIFPEKQPDGNWIRNIVFAFPVPYNGKEIREFPLESQSTVECVLLMSKVQ